MISQGRWPGRSSDTIRVHTWGPPPTAWVAADAPTGACNASTVVGSANQHGSAEYRGVCAWLAIHSRSTVESPGYGEQQYIATRLLG
jgi:hypothetical protein